MASDNYWNKLPADKQREYAKRFGSKKTAEAVVNSFRRNSLGKRLITNPPLERALDAGNISPSTANILNTMTGGIPDSLGFIESEGLMFIDGVPLRVSKATIQRFRDWAEDEDTTDAPDIEFDY